MCTPILLPCSSAFGMACTSTSSSPHASRTRSSSCFGGSLRMRKVHRVSPPPRPIIGPRICSYIARNLEERGHSVYIFDPRETQLPLLEKPHFAYAPSQVPLLLAQVNDELKKADAYVAITPEYNHAPSPALLNVLNHFGSSIFSFKRKFSGQITVSAHCTPSHKTQI